jgi:hypothetical protein
MLKKAVFLVSKLVCFAISSDAILPEWNGFTLWYPLGKFY